MRNIKPDASLMPEFSTLQPRLPIDKPIVQYIRQSTDRQVKENIQSKIQQDDMLGKRLLKYGWTEDKIMKIDKDQGISGQKRQDIREGLNELYHLIKDGSVGAIAAYDASRFWRDRTHVWYNDMISYLLIPYGIPVVMFNAVYFPNRDADMEALREEFKQAAYYLNHIYDKVNPARLQAIELGESYGGGAVPIGFVVVGTKGNRHYQVYEPHATLVRWIFKRYRELGGNLPRLARECQHMNFSFPAFTGIDTKPHIALPLVDGCYRLRSRDALVSILTNPAYIGWYIFDGVLISKTAHDAIVPLDDFMFAYSRLSPINLDGTPNTDRPQRDRHYGVSAQGLLEGLLFQGTNPCYVVAETQSYAAKTSTKDWQNIGAQTALVVSLHALDRAVSNAIRDVLIALKQQEKQGVQSDLHAQLDALQQRKASEAKTLASQLKGVEKSIQGWQLDKQSAREQQNQRELDTANKQLAILYREQASLLEQIDALSTETDELAETKTLLRDALDLWETWRFETKKRFVNLVVQRITFTDVTPHILKITVDLKPPINGYVEGHMYRLRGTKTDWTDEEMETIRQLYPHADRLDILQALPHRTWRTIVDRAMGAGVMRMTRLNTSGLGKSVTYADYCYRQQYADEHHGMPLFINHPGQFQWDVTHMGIGEAWAEAVKDHIDTKNTISRGFS